MKDKAAEPRVFYVLEFDDGRRQLSDYKPKETVFYNQQSKESVNLENTIKVIEYSAYEELEEHAEHCHKKHLDEWGKRLKLESLLDEMAGALKFMLNNYGSKNTAGCYEILKKYREDKSELQKETEGE